MVPRAGNSAPGLRRGRLLVAWKTSACGIRRINMRTTQNPGRVAGLWYLLLIVLGPLRLIYIPNKLFVEGNAAATVSNIAAHELLFRLGVVTDLAGAVALPAAVPGRLARARRLRLGCPERHRRAVAAIS